MLLNQVARFVPVARLVAQVHGSTLLDVGSGSAGIARWLPRGWMVTAVDRSWADYGSAPRPPDARTVRVEADARALPFPDASFDVVVSLDMVEHVPPEDRPVVRAELSRVAARRVVVACPTGMLALKADERLRERYGRWAREAPGWLVEHLELGLPEPEELLAMLPGARLVPNESLAAHERVMRLDASRWGGVASTVASHVLRALPMRWRERASKAVRGGDTPPTYRTIAVLDKQR